ncbi:MAG: GspH/FimT family pseudopilin [Shewanella sp.]
MHIMYRGFTLVELMVTVAIAAILLTIGVPSFTALYQSSRSSTEITKIANIFTFARNQAVNYGTTVTVCPYGEAACGTDWQKGFTVYIEPITVPKNILKVLNTSYEGDKTSVTGAAANKISFTADGLASGAASIIYCANGKSESSQSFSISTSGLIQEGAKGLPCTL